MPRRNQANNSTKDDKNSTRNLFMFLVFLTVFSVVLWYIIKNFLSFENSDAPFKDIIKDDEVDTLGPKDDDDDEDDKVTLGPVESNSRLLLFILIPVVIVMVVGLFFGGRLLKGGNAKVGNENSELRRPRFNFSKIQRLEFKMVLERARNASNRLNERIKNARGRTKEYFKRLKERLNEGIRKLREAINKQSAKIEQEKENLENVAEEASASTASSMRNTQVKDISEY